MESTTTYTCQCTAHRREFRFKSGMPTDVIDRLYCPECEAQGYTSDKSWPLEGGWALHFDLEIARMFAMAKLGIDPALVNPGFIMDRGYVTASAPP